MLYQSFIKPCFFSLDAERTHEWVLQGLKFSQSVPLLKRWIANQFSFSHPVLEMDLIGLKFRSPVGLAAGFDKNCELREILPCFGFGFIECGTVTAKAQEGNPKPRLFRLPESEALINRLGFNNHGAEKIKDQMKKSSGRSVPVGINIGKSRVTELKDAVGDYLFSFESLYPFAEYFTLNVSSPNTPNLRDLQKDLSPLLSAIREKNRALAQSSQMEPKPVFVKIAPDLSTAELDLIAECCVQHQISGIIATNTTVSRDDIQLAQPIDGGLSGRPLEKKSTEIVRHLCKHFGKKLIIIGVGGIFSAEDAYRKIKAGASLVQLYTGWIYGGPSTICRINQGLVSLLQRDGLKNINDAVGVEL